MLRRMNKFFSILLVIAMILSMIPAPSHDGHDHGHVHAAASRTLFLKPNSEWLVDGARFAAYFFGNGEKWVSMTGPDSNGYYKVSVPSGYPSVIFCRMNGGNADNNWDNKWNQTGDLTIPTSGECAWTLNSGDWGGGGSWSHLWNSGSVTKAATCTAAGTKTFKCSLCSATRTESIAKLGHGYKSKVTAPTCTAQGYTTWTCSRCSDSYKDTYKAATGHSYTSKVTKAATCTATGTKTYTCSKCSHSYTETIAKLGHSYTTKVTAPTCTAKGYTTHTCSRCSDSYKDTYTNATGHSYGTNGTCTKCGAGCNHSYTSTVTKAATCTATGTRKYTCSTCKYSYTETIAKLGHSYTTKVTAPTCTAQGYTTHTCSRCSDSYKDTYKNATGHSYTSTVTKAATCTADGTRKYTCSKCSNSYTETITKLGHSYKATVTAPTCTAGGYTTHKCSTCGNSYTDSQTAAKGHSYSGATCSSCGATRTYYLFGFINGANYACEEDSSNIGTYKFVNNTLTVKFTSNSYVAVKTGDNLSWYMTDGYPGDGVTSATLYNVDKGISADKLYVPGGTEVKFTLTVNKDETLKLSYTILSCQHTYDDGKVTKAATCTAEGVKTFTCTKCGNTKTEAIAKLGHSYSGASCTACGATRTYYLFGFINGANYACEEDAANIGSYKFVNNTLSVTFTSDSWVAVKTGDNLSWYMTDGYPGDGVKSATLYNTDKGIDANKLYVPGGTTVKFTLTVNTNETLKLSYTITSCSHRYTDTVTKEPTCTATGTRKYTCSVCGNSYTESIAAKGHSYTSKVTAPTCTAKGYTTYTCSVCGDSYTGNETAAKGHSYDSGKVTKAATCTADGVKTYTCTVCKATKTEAIAKLGHDYKSKVTAPTCTTQGYTTHTCSRCSDSYKDTYTAATGHNYSNGACTKCGDGCSHSWGTGKVTTAATCTANGVKTYTCSVCKATKTETIAATGHSYTSKVTAPTCTAKGYTTHTCSVCGHSYQDKETAATGHSYTSKVTTAATCTSDGVKTYTCSVCSHSYTEKISAIGHSYKAVVTAPTCTEGGYTTHTCANCGGSYTDSQTPAKGHSYEGDTCTACGAKRSYYLFGFINGANYGCEEDASTIGKYKFEGGKLIVTFDSDSYVAVKTGDNLSWYMTEGYDGSLTSVKLYNTSLGITAPDKMFVPGGAEITFTLEVNKDETVVLSYVISKCPHSFTESITKAPTCTAEGVKTFTCSICAESYTESIPATGHSFVGDTCTGCGTKREYYLFGYINGANYACEEDFANIGVYKFVNGKLIASFESDSYVAVKTGDNQSWYMTNGYPGDDATSAKLYNTATEGIEVNKMRIPGRTKVELTLVVNTDETLQLSFKILECSHDYTSEITAQPTCT
ncbi:MAG: hypothetical protein II290_00775, partial [Oscillospiraceae bacterium]|nr:hypothetical protein [Oscillospiraceae bacterium]